MTAAVPADILSRLKAVLGEGGWSDDPQRLAPKLVEWRDRWSGTTPLLVLPRTTAEVAAVVGLCAEAGVAIIPQGGNTGLVGGQIPQGEILLSTERMRAIRDLDPTDDVIVAEAGATLASVHEAALAAGRRFPLSVASEGSATIGGLVSTNAGGTAVLRYGFQFRKTDVTERMFRDPIETVVARTRSEVEHLQEPLSAIIQGVDDAWEVCLLKFTIDLIERSSDGNVGDFRKRGLL